MSPSAMQHEALVAPANADRLRSAFELKSYAFGDQRLSSSPRYLPSGGDDGLYRCSSPFSPSLGFSSPSPLATSVSLSPSSSASLVDDADYCGGAAAADATGHRLQLARVALQYQEVVDRYELCLSRLAEAVDEAAVLRRENAELRVANGDLARRVAMLGGTQTAAVAIADEIRRLRGLGDQKVHASPEKTAVLPKSISVRSSDYLKMNQPAPAAATPAVYSRKPRASNPTNPSSQQKWGADGGMKWGEEKKQLQKDRQPDASSGAAAELDVCNQGMFKTELCNKWEETGACPYGDQCQFAHGVSELRPVIRHPRYKTEVCRMVLNGQVCPYGHRCHFRHSLTAAERLLRRP
ncbi:zinc finger CCCH domain-containing protein 9 isoform X1 [Lolium perenne]|uniref:zinc finger CCCH domain-containing protein 9 isoform X1 n=1 Tax=Lolium perenne TaxID=4522 RepID=UPI0021F57FD1|nr:zinc finger CCCH domain-containing protein 9-like isoform X1 [Lolium perenne]